MAPDRITRLNAIKAVLILLLYSVGIFHENL